MSVKAAQNEITYGDLWDFRTGTFSSDMLKLTAMITMFIDHIGAGILEYLIVRVPLSHQTNDLLTTIDQVLRLIGRISFPLYCYLLVQGFLYTKSRIKYARNLFLFALLSEYPFDFLFANALDLSSLNVIFTLFIGLLTLWGIEKASSKLPLKIIIGAIGISIAAILHTDYSWMGILLILSLYFFRKNRFYQCTISLVLFFSALVFRAAGTYGSIWQAVLSQLSSKYTLLFSFWMMYRCNNRRYLQKGKYLFYLFYPAHLFLLGLILRLILLLLGFPIG
ncbi:MAG: conjugal transfer protein TraX [Lachnospiraceae bacterium]|nr:conjugal transfer protein TraX [Lachnospiraceae bacterium]